MEEGLGMEKEKKAKKAKKAKKSKYPDWYIGPPKPMRPKFGYGQELLLPSWAFVLI